MLCLFRALLIFLTSYATVFGFCDAFSFTFNRTLLFGFIAFISLFMSILYINRILFYTGYAVLLILFCLAFIRYYIYVTSGFQAITNILREFYSDHFNLTLMRKSTELYEDRYVTITYALMFTTVFLAMLLNVTISRYMNLVETVFITFLFWEIPLYIGVKPPLYAMIILLGAYVCVGILRAGTYSRTQVTGRHAHEFQWYHWHDKRYYSYRGNTLSACIILGFALIFSILVCSFSTGLYAASQDEPLPGSFKEKADNLVKTFVQTGFSGLFDRYDSVGGLNHGRLGGVSSVNPDFQTDLKVTFVPENTDTIYLPAYYGNTYLGSCWSSVYTDRFFIERSEDMRMYEIASRSSYTKFNNPERKMQIENVGADSQFLYTPYGSLRYNAGFLTRQPFDDENTVSEEMVDMLYPYSPIGSTLEIAYTPINYSASALQDAKTTADILGDYRSFTPQISIPNALYPEKNLKDPTPYNEMIEEISSDVQELPIDDSYISYLLQNEYIPSFSILIEKDESNQGHYLITCIYSDGSMTVFSESFETDTIIIGNNCVSLPSPEELPAEITTPEIWKLISPSEAIKNTTTYILTFPENIPYAIYLNYDEDDYLSYVYDCCCEVPAELEDYLRQFCKEKDYFGLGQCFINTGFIEAANDGKVNDYSSQFSNMDDFTLALCDGIRREFLNNYPYTLSPGTTPRSEDFIRYFLEYQQRGYCSHFASAAVMLLRSMGIPARYVEGYVVPSSTWLGEEESLRNDENADDWLYDDSLKGNPDAKVYTAEVSDFCAHAWIEVYLPSYGFVPYEMTPPSFEDVSTTPLGLSGLLSRLVDIDLGFGGGNGNVRNEQNVEVSHPVINEISISSDSILKPILFVLVLGIIVFALFILFKAIKKACLIHRYTSEGAFGKLILIKYKDFTDFLKKKKLLSADNPLPLETEAFINGILTSVTLPDADTTEMNICGETFHYMENVLYSNVTTTQEEYRNFCNELKVLKKKLKALKKKPSALKTA